MENEPIQVEVGDGFRILTLNRPESLNSFTQAMHTALANALREAEADTTCRALLLTGAGRGFCAGQDLADGGFTSGHAPDLAITIDKNYNPLVRKLRQLPIPIVCAVNGVAAGAGANIAFACDIVLAARSAKFIQAFSKIALVPDSGGTWFLPRLAGSARARALTLLGEPLAAEQAEAWGLIWRTVDDASLMTEARKLVAHLAKQPTGALALIKRALDLSEQNTLDQQLDLERDLQGQAGRGPDFAEGVAAFLEKRAAHFTGRI
ncbi:MAG: 2-(1,2-epoxy-1,2-dihydrophenyl)acetyl-CoA isomerase PaaG [Pseudomonadota bacterium]|jgi:2-(1,2-epoxy-1,2-dihydrophenyl)acetyl-CoA isomerase